MKRRLLASILSLVMVLSLLPATVLADDDGNTTTTARDVDDNEWTFTASADNSTITMVQGENQIVATLDDDTLTFTGSGTMPVLNDSTDAVSGLQIADYPWVIWKKFATKIVIGDDITCVGAKSFIAWPNVTEVELGKDVATIGAGAFAQLQKCSKFSVNAENKFFKVDNSVLYSADMSKLYYYPLTKTETTFNVPDSVTELGYNAICRNASLQTISFAGSDPLRLGFGSLFGNTALTTVNLDRNEVTFDSLVFNADNALNVVYCNTPEIKAAANKLMGNSQSKVAAALLPGGKYGLTSEDGYLYAVDEQSAIICGYSGTATELTIPSELEGKPVMMIAANAFANSDGTRTLTKVTIPASVNVIGQYAFVGWKDSSKFDSTLTDVAILGSDVEVGSMAFARHSNLRVDMTNVTNLTAEKNAFYSVSKIIVAASTQENLRNALAENNSLSSTTNVYVDTDQNSLYWHYVNGAWSAVASGASYLMDDQGLKYTVEYSTEGGTTITATAKITGYEKKGDATELVIPKTLPFTDAEGNTAQATVVSASGLRGQSGEHIINGIKTLTIAADLNSLNTTFVYWDNLETINVVGDVKNLTNCFGGGTSLKQVYFGNQNQITFGPAAFGNNPSLDVIDLSGVKSVEMKSAAGYDNRITDFYGTGKITVVYVGSEAVYQAIDKVTFPSNKGNDNSTVNTSGFSAEHNIVAITNGGTFDEKPTSNTALAEPSKEGYTFTGWYTDAGCTGIPVTSENAAAGVYYAGWTMSAVSLTASPESTVTYGTPVTLAVSPAVSGWTYTWYKVADGDDTPDTAKDTKVDNADSTLVLNNVSDSGTYYVVVKDGSGSNKSTDPITVTINRADGIASVSMTGWTYGETANKPVPESATNGIGAVTYQYKKTDADDSSYGNDVPINAGSYTVKAIFPATANYNEVSATSSFTIAKATPTLTINPDVDSLRGSGTVKLTVSGVPAGGSVIVTQTDNQNSAAKTLTVGTDGKYAVDLPNGTAVYTFTVNYAESHNYNASSATCTVSVTRYVPSGGSDRDRADVADAAIKAIKNAKPGETVTIDMKGETKMPARVLDAAYGKDMTLNFNMGGGTVWSVNGLDIPKGGVALNLGIKTGAKDVPVKLINAFTGEVSNVQLQLSHSGEFGLTLTLFLNLGKEFDGLFANLYYYNNKADALEFRSSCKISGGTASWPFDHASEYAIVIDKVNHDAARFTDVAADAYYAEAVKWALQNGITNGISNTAFGSNDPCTRAQIVTFLWRAAGSPEPKNVSSFTDVSANSYYAKAVAWAVENGITGGTGNGKFSPNATCTREQAVTFLYRASGSPVVSGGSAFSDVAASAYYADAVAWAEQNGVTGGIGNGKFGTGSDCTRAQIVTFLYRAYQGK